MSKNVYIRCPRCELNYILKKDKYCPVCKQEMQALSTNFVDGNNSELGLCPICKANHIVDDETVCSTCMSESDLTADEMDALYSVVVEKTEDVKEDELSDDDDDLEIVSLGDIESEEEAADEEDEEKSADPLDDFDDSLDDVDDDDEDDEEEDFDKDEE